MTRCVSGAARLRGLLPDRRACGAGTERIRGRGYAGYVPEYWSNWEHWFLGNALTQLIVTPFISTGCCGPRIGAISSAQWIEALVLLTGLVISLTLAFQPPRITWASPIRAFMPRWRFSSGQPCDLECAAPPPRPRYSRFSLSPPRNPATVRIPTESMSETASGLQQFLLLRAAPLVSRSRVAGARPAHPAIVARQ